MSWSALLLSVALLSPALAAAAPAPLPPLTVGDVVFIRVPFRPFVEVADATGSWTNHVGVVVAVDGDDVQVAESTVPWSRRTPLARFVARSEGGRVAVRRPRQPLDADARQRLQAAVERRLHVRYDTGFDLASRGQFCSRFVHEVLLDTTGTAVGRVQTFGQLLQQQPGANLGFWRWWFLGSIPWQRQTVTPASLLHSPHLAPLFDGVVVPGADQSGSMPNATSTRDTML